MVSIRSSNKRGQTFVDVIVISIVLLTAAISFVLVSLVQKNITDEFLATDEFNSSTVAGQTLQEFDSGFTTTLDTMFLIVFVLFWVFIIVSSLFIDASPIFVIISIILLAIVLILVAVMSNAYEEFISDGDVYTFAAGFPKMNYIMEHLVLFVVFIGLTGVLAIYGKNSIGGGP